MSETVKVHLLGRDYMLRSQGDPELVREAALLVEDKLLDVPTSVSVDTRDRYILAMLNMAGEYLQEKRKNQTVESERQGQQSMSAAAEDQMKNRDAELIARIENALNE